MHARRRLGSLAIAGLLLAAMAGTAQGHDKIREEGDYSNPFNETICGAYQLEGMDSGHYQIEEATKATNYQFFYFTNWYSGHTKITNPANGKSLTEDWSGVFKEVNARQYGDDPNVFQFETVDIGKYKVTNQRGRTVHRDKGVFVTQRIFDTFGDSTPGGYEIDYKEIKNTWDQSFDICVLADKLIG